MTSRPEQTFFTDPALDRALGMVMTMAAELHVTRDRLRTLETILVEQGALAPGALDDFEPTPEQQASIAADRDAFVSSLLEHVKGTQVSKGLIA